MTLHVLSYFYTSPTAERASCLPLLAAYLRPPSISSFEKKGKHSSHMGVSLVCRHWWIPLDVLSAHRLSHVKFYIRSQWYLHRIQQFVRGYTLLAARQSTQLLLPVGARHVRLKSSPSSHYLNLQYCPFKSRMIESFTTRSLRRCPGLGSVRGLIRSKFLLLRLICHRQSISRRFLCRDWCSGVGIIADEKRMSQPSDPNSTYSGHHGRLTWERSGGVI